VTDYGPPILYALFVWWFSTGAILYLDGLPSRSFRWSMGAATAVAGLALYGLAASSADASVMGAYTAFSCGLLVWAWHEMAFLMGFVTGPRPRALPPGRTGWRRFGHAVGALIYHELAIAVTAALVVALTWGGANQIGALTFLVLWAMRLSAKLNLFLGVPNVGEEFLPAHLGFLRSYLRTRPMNALFPLSVTAATAVAALVIHGAATAEPGSFEVAGLTFLGTLLALGVLEHWFMVVPLPVASLWSWGFRSRVAHPALEPEIVPLGALSTNQTSAHRRRP